MQDIDIYTKKAMRFPGVIYFFISAVGSSGDDLIEKQILTIVCENPTGIEILLRRK